MVLKPSAVHRLLPPGHPPVAPDRIGILLLNLGTPDATDYWSVRRYLKQFLSDRRVVDVNPALWWAILNGAILTFRPSRSGAAYAKIWNKERNESPLRTITRSQAERLSARFGSEPAVLVDWAMRYGNPSTSSRLHAMAQAGCRRILLLPLYPQYSAATTGTACDEAFRALMIERWQPSVRTTPSWHDDPMYIDTLARSIEHALDALAWEPEVLLASFHGLPKRFLALGDPYHCECAKTTRLLRERLGWSEDRLRLTFQSRFGREEWLQPYTDETLKTLAAGGVKRLAVVSPGFVADCIETLEEIAIEGRQTFEEHGGEHYAYIPCLNDGDDQIDLLEAIARRELSGWLAARQGARVT